MRVRQNDKRQPRLARLLFAVLFTCVIGGFATAYCMRPVEITQSAGAASDVAKKASAAKEATAAEASSAATLVPTGSTSWPSFRNGNQLLGVATSTLPSKLELLWKYPATDGVVSAAAIVGDHVYVGILGGELLCLKRATGKLVWKYLSAPRKTPNTFIAGFQSSPTVTHDAVFVGDEDGVFHAVDRTTGKKKWQFQTGAEIIAAAAVVGEKVIFGSYDSTLYCLKAGDGTKI